MESERRRSFVKRSVLEFIEREREFDWIYPSRICRWNEGELRRERGGEIKNNRSLVSLIYSRATLATMRKNAKRIYPGPSLNLLRAILHADFQGVLLSEPSLSLSKQKGKRKREWRKGEFHRASLKEDRRRVGRKEEKKKIGDLGSGYLNSSCFFRGVGADFPPSPKPKRTGSFLSRLLSSVSLRRKRRNSRQLTGSEHRFP